MSGDSKLNRPEYEALLKPLGKELVSLSRWVGEKGKRIVVIFEGRDTAGKGGSIDMFARVLNPRQCRVVALPSPSKREQSQWYFQRYIDHLPAAGEIVLFDRSWYNRAGVEKVMGYADEAQVEAFLKAVPEFERHLVDDGIMLFKYWLCCDQSVQELRFGNRLRNPMKRWKLSPIDQQARLHYDAYTEAREEMLRVTHTDFAPWTLIEFNDQQVGRLTLLRDFLDRVPDTELPLAEIDWPPLDHEPSKERYSVLQPLEPYKLPDEIEQRDMIHSWD
ncbi:polyphosphate kinase 2 [Sphingomonas lutea]|uniref:ADP/GDP-polyphosphate phosphotransferase n=1 Tax=Sphingomonas lutea TaxID=1045317 RepID=A0A7G9SKG0_9SPHN|nr:polyphosphate kinase 2 [Sphingomonas lutea]QNN68335.1 polyphosphate kinase 2 [Sphingomonas lutea]